MKGFLHLFELEQTFLAADGFAAVVPLHQEFVRAGAATDVTQKQGQVFSFVVVDETAVAANPLCRSVQSLSEFTLRATKQQVKVTARVHLFKSRKKRERCSSNLSSNLI